jgi:UDP-glucose 4-epimerase
MRVLVTGLGTYFGSKLAQVLESEPGVDLVVGVDTRAPVLPLERTEYVRADGSFSILERMVKATRVDTVLHTHLVVDSTQVRGRTLHEVNVIGTMNLLAAAGAAGSTVRKLVVKGSTLSYGTTFADPFFFGEATPRTGGPRTRVERSLHEVSALVGDFAEDNPHVTVTKLRFANVLGEHVDSPLTRMLRLPVVPEVFGFDPRVQFVHEDDVTGAIAYATHQDVPGLFNVAGEGTMPWSEVCTIVGKRRVPMPPFLTSLAAEPLRLARLVDIPPEVLGLLRYGRGVDTSRFCQAGYRYQHTTAGAVDAFARGLRLQTTVGRREYEYQRDVESFFRHSPAVVREEA